MRRWIPILIWGNAILAALLLSGILVLKEVSWRWFPDWTMRHVWLAEPVARAAAEELGFIPGVLPAHHGSLNRQILWRLIDDPHCGDAAFMLLGIGNGAEDLWANRSLLDHLPRKRVERSIFRIQYLRSHHGWNDLSVDAWEHLSSRYTDRVFPPSSRTLDAHLAFYEAVWGHAWRRRAVEVWANGNKHARFPVLLAHLDEPQGLLEAAALIGVNRFFRHVLAVRWHDLVSPELRPDLVRWADRTMSNPKVAREVMARWASTKHVGDRRFLGRFLRALVAGDLA